jgi:hypothetical protein
VKTLSFESKLNFLAKQRNYSVNFTSDNNSIFLAAVMDSKKGSYTLESKLPIFSDLSYQISLRQQLIKNPEGELFSFLVAKNKSKMKRYVFKRGKNKLIQTKLGSIEATPLIYQLNSEDTIKLWLAESYDYLVVAAENTESGITVYSLLIESLMVNEMSIKAFK